MSFISRLHRFHFHPRQSFGFSMLTPRYPKRARSSPAAIFVPVMILSDKSHDFLLGHRGELLGRSRRAPPGSSTPWFRWTGGRLRGSRSWWRLLRVWPVTPPELFSYFTFSRLLFSFSASEGASRSLHVKHLQSPGARRSSEV